MARRRFPTCNCQVTVLGEATILVCKDGYGTSPMKQHASTFLFLGYAGLVSWASLSPGGSTDIGANDKLAHFLTYALFAVFAFRLRLGAAGFILCCLGIVLYSALLEYAQSFIPGRTMSGLDLLANSLGVLVGAMACRWLGTAAETSP